MEVGLKLTYNILNKINKKYSDIFMYNLALDGLGNYEFVEGYIYA